MTRTRVSTTVDDTLLRRARQACEGEPDSVMLDRALEALLARQRRASIDQAYGAAYEAHPPDETDEWGDLASFRQAAASS